MNQYSLIQINKQTKTKGTDHMISTKKEKINNVVQLKTSAKKRR